VFEFLLHRMFYMSRETSRAAPLDVGRHPRFIQKKYLVQCNTLLWLIVPSIIWTVGLHALTLCGDPLVLQAIDRRLNRKVAILLRGIWVLCFAVALLQSWNISPGTYSFYFNEALPFSPASVLASLALGGLWLTLFVLVPNTRSLPSAWSNSLFGIGLTLFVTKIVIVTIGAAPYMQQYTRFPSITIVRLGINVLKPNVLSSVVPTPNLTFNSFLPLEKPLPKKLVLMLVESWAETPAGLNQIAAEIRKNEFVIVRSGFTTFKGGTLSGEFRELCSQYLLPSDGLREASRHLDCAPRSLSKLGYEAVGIHGFNKSFYARATFWQRFGFARGMFREQFATSQYCPGAFDGVCDDNLIHRGVSVLGADRQPRFVYMLTLSSHEPLEQALLQRRGTYFDTVEAVHPTQVVARHAISDLMAELKAQKNLGCVLVHVVGDHQPRTGLTASMGFPLHQVPYLMLSYHCPGSAN
jgi:hypothetical protein